MDFNSFLSVLLVLVAFSPRTIISLVQSNLGKPKPQYAYNSTCDDENELFERERRNKNNMNKTSF
jgi:hypothetical protein